MAPALGANINDSLVNFVVAGGSATYHVTEVMALACLAHLHSALRQTCSTRSSPITTFFQKFR